MIGAEVVGGDINSAIRFLKRAIGKDGVHKMVKRRLDFPKPSLRRREKVAIATRRRLKAERRREYYGQHKRFRGSSILG